MNRNLHEQSLEGAISKFDGTEPDRAAFYQQETPPVKGGIIGVSMEADACAVVMEADGVNAEPDLVERAKCDRDAFSQLYRLHYRAIASYLYRRTGDVHVTEELVSDVFFTTLRTLHRFEQRGIPFRSWLYRIATNAVNNWARRRRRELRRLSDTAQYEQTKTSEAAALTTELRPELLRAFQSLSPKHQTVLALHHLEELSVDQIALVIGRSPGTVKSRLSRAREAMRKNLKESGAI